jgi:2-keto-4-pentenoate hydratase/2-oxohepta-3-ene-1,7-dioic acid hydratase in catechol pathway
MVNYRAHARESGFDPDAVRPTFFRKAFGSVVGPTSPIVRPTHVRLLDYEVELGLVIGADIPVGATITDADLPDVVVGLVLANDVSARDVQLTKGQFYESKSYPTFTPLGPRLTLLEAAEFAALPDLRLQLRVNGALRQDRTVADMICPPATALTTLARFQALAPGDVLLIGTPAARRCRHHRKWSRRSPRSSHPA